MIFFAWGNSILHLLPIYIYFAVVDSISSIFLCMLGNQRRHVVYGSIIDSGNECRWNWATAET